MAIQGDKTKLFCFPLSVSRGKAASTAKDDFYFYPILQLS